MTDITQFPIPTEVLDPANYPEFVGPQGDTGPQGPQGPQGEKGDTGDLFTDGSTIPGYYETGATLSVTDDGDGTYSVTIPIDGGIYAVTLDQDVDLLTSDAPTAPVCGSAVVYITQDATAKAVSVPAGWYWPDGTAEAFDEDSALYRLTLYTDPAGNVHADAELRATV